MRRRRAILIARCVVAFYVVASFRGEARALEPIPDRLVVITFDDSAKSHFTVVRPLLKKLGFGATFFITEGFDFKENKRDYMTWDEIKRLHDDGFEIGNHTRDHFSVNASNVDRLREQIESITVRCREHGIPDPVSFAYPGNGIDPKAFPVLREAGIKWARRGGAPEYPYAEGKGFAYEPGVDHPLLIPSAGDARPGWTLSDLRRAVDQAKDGRVCVLQFHGTPDTAHQWVNLPPYKFEPFLNHLKARGCTVIALRDLARYVDPDKTPDDAMAVVERRRETLRAGTTIVHPVDGAEMVYVPAGRYVVGITEANAAEIARHFGLEGTQGVHVAERFAQALVELPGFFIDKSPVTVGRWKKFTQATARQNAKPEANGADDPLQPMTGVTWLDANAFAAWAKRTLPTGIEWEAAARGADGTLYPWGNDAPTEARGRFSLAGADVRPPRVGSFADGASPFGALDLVGTIFEWTTEQESDTPDAPSPGTVERRPATKSNGRPVQVRGGLWTKEDGVPFAARTRLRKPDERSPTLGFRTVWTPPKGYFDSDQFRRDSNAVEQLASPLTAGERKTLETSLRQVNELVAKLPAENKADAAIFTKGVEWALRYDVEFTRADRRLMDKALTRARERANAILKNRIGWVAHRGRKTHGYTSAVDSSSQPYGLVIPAKYDPKMPHRLDVVLHGSTRPVGMSELRFIARYDEGDDGASFVPDAPYIELHPLGRVENCYRWAGETDVFEAIADVCRRYNIDKSRIVLRGMSMGASGTWHLGLKHPSFFAALGPYCGYVDTHRFSETPLPNFVKVGPLPEFQERMLHMLDSVDYAANAAVVPAVACMGEKDIFFDAHVIMGDAFKKEGVPFVNLISPGTGHVVDPVTHAEQLRRIAMHLEQRGRPKENVLDDPFTRDRRIQPREPRPPDEVRFVTWTLKYARSHWIELHGLGRHYDRAEIVARHRDGVVDITKVENVTRFAVVPENLGAPVKTVRVGGVEIPFPPPRHADGVPLVNYIERAGDGWRLLKDEATIPDTALRKRPGLQGPIDDAFTSAFLCVRPTGEAWNAAANDYAKATLDRFAEEWRHYFRGACPVKDDVDVTDEDLETKNLILFGDPGSNRWVAKALPSLPLRWTNDTLTFRGGEHSSKDHVPALIHPSPFTRRDPSQPGDETRYVVLNSGHTFREFELGKVNYLLFPRWGDWAVLDVRANPNGAEGTGPGRTGPSLETVVRTGFFNEAWR